MTAYKFLIQKDLNGLPSYEFGYNIIKNIQILNDFKNNKLLYSLIDINDIKHFSNICEMISSNRIFYTPVGSVEFVERFMSSINVNIPKPLNIPEHLRKVRYCRRIVDEISFDEYKKNEVKYKDYYIKSADKYKHFDITKGNLFNFFVTDIDNIKNLFISSEIKPKIVNEFRCFIFNNKIVTIKPYINDLIYKISDKHVELVNEIIDLNIKNNLGLSYYCIDYAVVEDGSFELIELHHPYSVGTYGYNDESLVHFFLRGFYEIVNKKGV